MAEDVQQSGIKLSTILIILSIVLLGGLFAFGYMIFGRSERKIHNVEFEVADLKWERTIEVEEFGLTERETWKNELPQGAKVLSEKQMLRRVDQVDTGKKQTTFKLVKREVPTEESYGCYVRPRYGKTYWSTNCKRTVMVKREKLEEVLEPVYEKRPVYDTWCRCQINDWHKVSPSVAAGQGFAQKPEWKTVAESPTRRMQKRTETYVIKLSRTDMPGSIYYMDVSPEQIGQFAAGSKLYLNLETDEKRLKQPSRDLNW